VVNPSLKFFQREQKTVDCEIVQLYICLPKGGKSAMAKKKKATTKKSSKKTTKKKK
jgi:ribosomal protein S27E